MSQKIKVGVIGCGLIAQSMHIPHLKELEDRYEIEAICDISEKLVNKVGDYYNVKRRFTDYEKLLDTNIDAILVLTYLHSDESIAAARAGKHVFVEKPAAFSVWEVDRMIAAAKENNVVLMVGHMQRYDPAYEYALPLIKKMRDVKLVRLHTLVGPNDAFINNIYNIWHFDDVALEKSNELEKKKKERIEMAIGKVSQNLQEAYEFMIMLSSHDMTILRGMFGEPNKIKSADIWGKSKWGSWGANTYYYSVTLDYGNNIRCLFDAGVMNIAKVDRSLEIFSDDLVVKLHYTSPFLKNAPTYLNIWQMEGGAYSEKKVLVSYETSFKRELVHFHDCITIGKYPRTDAEEAKQDLMLFKKIIEIYLKTG